MTAAAAKPGRRWRLAHWIWPLGLLLIAWLITPLRAGATYPGMPCTAQADTVFGLASYTILIIPTAALLLLFSRQLIPAAVRRGLRAWAAGLSILGLGIAIVYLAFGGVSADRRPLQASEQSISCPLLGAGLRALHCWRSGSTIEMNAYAPRPLDVAGVLSMASALQATKQDATLYEAFVLDTADTSVANYSNARLFILQRPGLTDFGDLCLGEHQAKAREVQAHRVGFYRFSAQQSPPVDAFFLQDTASGGELGYEVIDFLHGRLTLPYVRPSDLQPTESDYLDRVTRSMATLQRITADLPIATPFRLIPYRDGRVQRFLQNYDLILTAEESAAQGQSGQAIHSTAYQEHRRYYYQEARVARLIGYLYLQQPGQVFTDDELSTVNWAVF
ncbi:MAG: DUF1109 domain-containing protein [Chloroflexi bacterium]|nr:MAG: DUF1109 domain-containing protein [Chloroflexota bacterium]